MNPQRLQYLFEKYFDKTASAEERTELSEQLSNEANKEEILELFAAAWERYHGDGDIIAPARSSAILQEILAKDKEGAIIGEIRPERSLKWRSNAAAAAIILIICSVSYLYFHKKQTPTEIVSAPIIHDVKAPVSNRALITLSNGQKVFLDSAANGHLASQGNIQIVKLDNGIIAYQGEKQSTDQPIQYNTLENPRGSNVINITLSDGSKVWLNASSSLTYPIAFNGKDRKVTITGEAYFEVAHDPNKPFTVSKGTTSVQVLGTHFNVNAYDDESVLKVTLLEGSVKVGNGNETKTIRPGDQAQVKASPDPSNRRENIELFTGIDTDEVMAWKEGKFKFSSADIETILRQAARWYDVDIEYKGKTNETFSGGIGRTENISQLLHILEITNKVHFEINGKKIIVQP